MESEYAVEVANRLSALEVVNAASLREVRRDVSRQVETEPPRDVIELALHVAELKPPLGHAFAYELIRYHPTALSKLGVSHLRRFGRGMNGWGEVDAFGGLAGLAWRNGQVSDEEVHRWARSKNRWWRRAALVSTVPLNVRSQGGQGDAKRTLSVCRLLMEDRDDMVVKAMSWALRALAVREPAVVSDFVDENEHRLARRAVREVKNKLRTGRKSGREY